MNSYTIKYGDTLSGIASQTGKSIQEILKLNPSITDPNKIRAGASLNLGGTTTPVTSTPTGTTNTQNSTTTPAKKTIADVAKITVPDYTEDPNVAAVGNTYKTQATQTIDEEGIRAASRARLQSLIDSINLAAQDQIAKFRNTTAKNRTGQSYALAAAGGRIGSATSEGEFQNVENMNNAEAQTYQDEANNKINSLLSTAAKDATDEINAKRTAISQGADKYLEYLSGVSARKQAQATALVKNMLTLGVDPTNLSDSDVQKLQTQYGVSKDQIIALYNDAKTAKANADLETKKTQAELDKNNTFTLNEGDARYTVDPVTGKATLIASRAKTFAPSSSVASTGISPELAASINNGEIDPNKLNSRTLGIYESIAKAKVDAVGSHAGAAGETKAITDLSSYKSTATRTLGVLESNLPLVENLADKVNVTGVPGIDRIIQGTQTYTGNNPDVIKYVNTLKTLRSEYAQMLSKGNVATESDKHEAEQAIPAGLSSAGYASLGVQLKTEAQNILKATDDAIRAAKSKSASNSYLNSDQSTAPVDPATQNLRDKYKY